MAETVDEKEAEPVNAEVPEIVNDAAVRAANDVAPLVMDKDVPEIDAKLDAPEMVREVPLTTPTMEGPDTYREAVLT